MNDINRKTEVLNWSLNLLNMKIAELSLLDQKIWGSMLRQTMAQRDAIQELIDAEIAAKSVTERNDKDEIVFVLSSLHYQNPALDELADAIKIVQAYQPALRQMEQCDLCKSIVTSKCSNGLPWVIEQIYFNEDIREYVLCLGRVIHGGSGFSSRVIVIHNCPNCGRKLMEVE